MFKARWIAPLLILDQKQVEITNSQQGSNIMISFFATIYLVDET